jgi:hypothetical protein
VADPTIVQSATGFAGAGVTTYSVTLAAPAGAGRAVVLCAGGDKNIGAAFGPVQTGTTVPVDLRSASVSQVVAWYPTGAGGQTVISGTVGANIAGTNLFALEIEQDADPGVWTLVAVATLNTTEANTLVQSTGTTGAAIAVGLAIATVSCDSVNTAGTPSWSNGFTARYSSADGSTQSGLWVSTKPVAAAATVETTLTRTGGTSDQHSGSVIVLGKVDTPPVDVDGVPFLVEDLGADAVLLVEIAFGADVLGDPTAWPWVDVTEDVRTASPITTRLGRGDEASVSQPAALQLVLDNTAGDYSLGGRSRWWPFIRQGAPVRVSIDPDDGDGSRIVLLGFAAEWAPAWDDLDGRVPVVTLTAAGTLRRLAQGTAPVASALRRALTVTGSVVSYWPMEDGKDVTFIRAVEGPDMTFTGKAKPHSGAGVFNCSDAIVDAGDAAFTANVEPYVANGFSQVRFLIQVPEDGLTDGTVLAYVWTSGTLLRWDIVYSITGTGNLGLYVYNADGTLNSSTPAITFDMNGKDRRLSLELTQNGTGVDWQLGTVQPSDLGAGAFTGSIASRSFLTVTQVQLAPLAGCSGTLYGHLTVQNAVTSLYESTGALRAHVGEFPSSSNAAVSRTTRLCSENGVALDRFTSVGGFLHPGEALGPQLVAPLLDLLRECETQDQGQIWDGRHAGLTYTTRRYRELGTVALTIDAGAGELAAPWTPTHDDQRLRNKVTGEQLQGVRSVFEDVTGERGTAVSGTYDSTLTVNCRVGEQALQAAAWQVHLGTVTDYRLPTVTVDLRASPQLAGAVLDVIPGDRIDVLDPSEVLAGFPVGDVALIVEGIAHAITPASWRVTFQCSPWTSWGVAEYAAETGDTSAMVWRADTAGAALNAAALASATSISVATTSGPLWTTVADDYPLLLSVGGVQVRATACSGTSSPQTMTVDALPVARAAAAPVTLWDQRPLGL